MNHDLAFVEEIRADPHDEMPRLIYADYLEDTGDPRGELIRVQCELAKLPPGDPARVGLNARERELLDSHAEKWLQLLRELGAEGISARCFQRGLIERIRMRAATFLANGEELCRFAPAVYCVELRNPQDVLDELVAASMPAQISEIDFSANRLDAAAIRAFHDAPWTEQVEALNVQFNQLSDDGLTELLACNWPKLQRLNLGANRIGPAGFQALSDSLAMAHVSELSLNVNSAGDAGAAMMANSANFEHIRQLDLGSNGIGSAGAASIARSGAFPALKRLNLRANRIGRAGRDALFQSTTLSLDSLDLRNNNAE